MMVAFLAAFVTVGLLYLIFLALTTSVKGVR
jgi:hypothetical protein